MCVTFCLYEISNVLFKLSQERWPVRKDPHTEHDAKVSSQTTHSGKWLCKTFLCYDECMKCHGSALTGGIMMPQEGIDKVCVDVVTVHGMEVHLTHPVAQFLHTTRARQRQRGFRNILKFDEKKFLPEMTGLTLSGKLGRRSSWCWGRTATRRAHLAGGASVWPWTTSRWTLGRSGVPESGTATPPRWRSPWSQQPPRWSSAWGGGSKWSSRLTEETLTQLDITYLRVDCVFSMTSHSIALLKKKMWTHMWVLEIHTGV